MNTGIHLIVDVVNITTKNRALNTIEGIEPLMRKIIEIGKLNVVGEIKHQFQPIGSTLLYLLSESHFSIHTYPEKFCCAIDLYSCNPNIDMTQILEAIFSFFNADCIILKKIINR